MRDSGTPPEQRGTADVPPATDSLALARVSQWDIIAKQFRKNRLAVWGLRVTVTLVLLAFYAPVIASGVPFVWKRPQDDAVSYPWLTTLMNKGVWEHTLDRLFNLGMLVLTVYLLAALVMRVVPAWRASWQRVRGRVRLALLGVFLVLSIAHVFQESIAASWSWFGWFLLAAGLAAAAVWWIGRRANRTIAWWAVRGVGVLILVAVCAKWIPFLSDETRKVNYREPVNMVRDARDLAQALPIVEDLLARDDDLTKNCKQAIEQLALAKTELQRQEGEAALSIFAKLDELASDIQKTENQARTDAMAYTRRLARLSGDESSDRMRNVIETLSNNKNSAREAIAAAMASLDGDRSNDGAKMRRKFGSLKSKIEEQLTSLPAALRSGLRSAQSDSMRTLLRSKETAALPSPAANDPLTALGLPTSNQARAYVAFAERNLADHIRVMTHVPYGYDDQLPRKYDKFRLSMDFARGERHYLGTTENGEDVFVRMLYGLRIGLTIGIVAVSLYVLIGIIMGALAGFFRGRVDMIIMRIVEMMLCIPGLFLILTIVSIFEKRTIFHIMLAIGLVSWTGVTRLVRGEFLRERNREYVTAAQAMGYSTPRIIFRHILPNSMGPVLVVATFGVVGAILTESGLSFLGLGDANVPSWGAILEHGKNNEYWHLILPPSVAIFITVTALNLVGDGLRDALDPKLRD